MRGVAILAVVAVHAWEGSWEVLDSPVARSSLLFQAFMLLRYGVELFFALSGWLIFSLYHGTERHSMRSYWSRRLARIWPLWAIFVAATLAATTLSPLTFPQNLPDVGGPPPLAVALALALLFLGWLNPFTWQVPPGGWSIQVEMGHYALFWPLRKAAPVLLIGTVVIGYITYFVAQALSVRSPQEFGTEFARDWLRLGIFGTWPFFIAGGLAYLWSRHRFRWHPSAAFPTPLARTAAAAGLIAIAVLSLVVPVPLGKSYEAAVTTLVLLLAALVTSRWSRARAILANLGKYSYFMYFAHFWVLALVFLAIRSVDTVPTVSTPMLVLIAASLFVMSTAMSWAVGTLSWRFFEAPILRAARRVG